MEKRYKISLFFILILVAVLVVALLWKRHTMSGFPQDDEDISEEDLVKNLILDDLDRDMGRARLKDASEVQQMNIVTTSDTICIYENIDKKDGSISMEERKLPAKYVGMRRDELEAALAEDSLVLTLEDKERCFKTQHLELFSADRIKILRIYDTTQELYGFYIREQDGAINVYKQDGVTLHFQTDLRPEDLPADVLEEVRKGKYMDTEVQVFHFLESYSS